jgi:peptidoglycan/xylan/chitin deacetylase (PgdA/CDA1 family)
VYGDDPIGEARIALRRINQLQVDGYVIDAESQYKKPEKKEAARRFMAELRNSLPVFPIALSSYRYPSLHPQLPWKEFLEKCDYNMPQVYWMQAHNPGAQLARCMREFQAMAPYRTIIPTGAAFREHGWQPTAGEILEFLKKAKEVNLPGVNFWEWSEARSGIIPSAWETIRDFSWTGEPQPQDICQQLVEAFNQHNPELMVNLYTPTAVHVTSGRTIQGIEAIRQWYTSFFNQILPKASFTLTGFSGTGSSRHFTWTAASNTVVVQNGNDTLGLVNGKIAYHYNFSLPRLPRIRSILLFLGISILIAACSSAQDRKVLPSSVTETTSNTDAYETLAQLPNPSLTPTATKTDANTNPDFHHHAHLHLTPEPLPIFTTRLIRPGIAPQTYITDTCTYLKMRWSPEGSPPGTVVIPVMFHGIRESGKPVSDNVTITEEQFRDFIQYAQYLGFQTITSAQLVQFLETNTPIPARSLMMIVDDRRPGTVETYFMPVLKENNWTVTLGWIIADTDEALWQRMETMDATGLLDVQSHGYLHRYILPEMKEDEVREEVTASIPVLEEHFEQRPVAFVWPGGNYTPYAVQVARQAGFKLGFTANSNGPLMFNWIPLGESEQAIHDPLMVLPRGWSTARAVNLDWAAQVGDKARQAAIESYPQEEAYYQTYCGGELPPLESILPEK